MKALVYDPYLNTLGGGERYCLHLAELLVKKNFKVIIPWFNTGIKAEIKKRLNIDLENAEFSPSFWQVLNQQKSFWSKIKTTQEFDLIFFLSDGSLPFLFGKKNLIHFQVPFTNIGGKKLLNRIKLKLISKIICNSYFTKKFIDREFNVESRVIYPPVVSEFKPGSKENLILSVGRFDNTLQAKKQDVLIQAFKELLNDFSLKNWRFILVGGCLKTNLTDRLKKLSYGYPIEIYENLAFEKLKLFYSQAKIYWHATGFGEDLEKYPQKAEHFGISVIEAMSAGCIPIAFYGGGLPEIIEDKKNGFLFQDLFSLKQFTFNIIKNEKLRKEISRQALLRAQIFSLKRFYQEFNEIIN